MPFTAFLVTESFIAKCGQYYFLVVIILYDRASYLAVIEVQAGMVVVFVG